MFGAVEKTLYIIYQAKEYLRGASFSLRAPACEILKWRRDSVASQPPWNTIKTVASRRLHDFSQSNGELLCPVTPATVVKILKRLVYRSTKSFSGSLSLAKRVFGREVAVKVFKLSQGNKPQLPFRRTLPFRSNDLKAFEGQAKGELIKEATARNPEIIEMRAGSDNASGAQRR